MALEYCRRAAVSRPKTALQIHWKSKVLHPLQHALERRALARTETFNLPYYEHDRLEDSKKQIRLFRIKPGRKFDGLELELGVFDVEDAPEYFAVSYAWGHSNTRILRINGSPFKVRENCHYALWQIRLHYPERLLWLDSICIDQEHLLEKAHQVSMLKDIYVEAFLILVCVGPHEDDSETVLDFHRQIVEAENWIEQSHATDWGTFWCRFFHGFSNAYLLCMFRSMSAFGERPYFKRLWILQELAAARKSAQLFCGHDMFAWRTLETMSQRLVDQLPWFPSMKLSMAIINNGVERTSPTRWLSQVSFEDSSLETVLSNTRHCQYSVAHDRIYAILPLVKWYGRTPILVDYGKPLLSLAREAVSHLDSPYLSIKSVTALLEDLGLSYTHSAMERLRLERASQRCSDHDGDDAAPATPGQGCDSLTVECSVRGYSRVSSTSGRSLVTNVSFHPWPEEEYHVLLAETDMLSGPCTGQKHLKAIVCSAPPSKNAQSVAGYVSGATQIQDVIVQIDQVGVGYRVGNRGLTSILVLREASQGQWDIVGQGALLPGFNCHSPARGTVRMLFTMTAEDAVLFAGQDTTTEDQDDLKARMQNMVVHPVSVPERAASLWIWEWDDLLDHGVEKKLCRSEFAEDEEAFGSDKKSIPPTDGETI